MPLVNGQYVVDAALIQKLDTNGDESGNTNFNADYSVTPEIAFIQPPAGRIMRIDSLEISVLDTGTFNSTDYGNIAGLTNGVLLRTLINGVLAFDPNKTVNNNAELFSTGQRKDLINYTNNEVGAYSTFIFTAPIYLNGDTGDQLQMFLNDNFTGITVHEFVVVGVF